MESNRSEDCRSQSRWKTKGRVFAASYDCDQCNARLLWSVWPVINIVEFILYLLLNVITELYLVDPVWSYNFYK